MIMKAMRYSLAAMGALAASLLALPRAQAISIGTPAPEELHPGLPLTASAADCDDDRGFTFRFVDLQANDSVEIWATVSAADCSLAEERGEPGR
jgi:hypothetical protein